MTRRNKKESLIRRTGEKGNHCCPLKKAPRLSASDTRKFVLTFLIGLSNTISPRCGVLTSGVTRTLDPGTMSGSMETER
jgi:hypothetical protein